MTLKRILHADDNRDMREVTKIALETVGGFALHQCSDGFSAVRAAQNFRPDLLLLDVMMPKLSGPQVLRHVKALPGFETIPAIFLTVKAQDNFAKSLREQGAIGVIAKPFDPMTLAREVTELWSKSVLQTI